MTVAWLEVGVGGGGAVVVMWVMMAGSRQCWWGWDRDGGEVNDWR